MARREWPLVAFTLLSQFAVGFYLFSALPRLLGGGGADRPDRFRPLAIVFAAGSLAAAVSFFHLGRPWRAPRVLANLKTSWLSREILCELAFLAGVAGTALLVLAGRGDGFALRAMAWAAAFFGAALVGAMGRLYMIPGVKAWDRIATPAAFILSAALLGLLGAAAAATAGAGSSADPGGLAGPAAMLLSAAFLVHLLYTPGTGLRGFREAPTLKQPVASSPRLFAVRLALLAGSALALFPIVAEPAGAVNGRTALSIWAALGLTAASEIIGRFQFYAWGVRPGDPA